MNKILNLFDTKYVTELFKKEALGYFPEFCGVKNVNIIVHKQHVWEETYHIVLEFRTEFEKNNRETETFSIFCSAHSDEPRKNVYDSLKFLWDNGFSGKYLTIPQALFYSEYFRAVFYYGVDGQNLYQYIRVGDTKEIEKIIPRAAKWFATLHNMNAKKAKNFNEQNSRIETVVPGTEHILESIGKWYPEYKERFRALYKIFIDKENEFLNSTDKRWLVHGDAHPENVIKISDKSIAVIDFTDLCLADFARDLGTFIQQAEFMIMRKMHDQKYADKIKNMFLAHYFKSSKEKYNASVEARMKNYFAWTAIRTATFYMMKHNPEPERGYPLIEKVEKEFLGL